MGKNSVFLGFILVLICLLYSGCEDTTTIGFPAGEEKIQTLFLDTFTVKTSTVVLDSIVTSTGRLLVGEYQDAVFGKTKATSYFQVASSNSAYWSPSTSAVYDSAALILMYDKYFYGDTTQVQTLSVNELSDDITPRAFPPLDNENYSYFYSGNTFLFNNSVTKSYPAVLGSINYAPRPLGDTAIFVRLNNDTGKDWLEIAKAADKSQLTPGNFVNLFKGVKISTSGPSNAAVVGFSATTSILRIYYNEPDAEGLLTRNHFDFKLSDANFHYNQITADRTGTPLQNLVPGKPVGSEQTNNETFVQAGAGVLTKIEFPSFKYLTSSSEKFMILGARLVVIPVIPVDNKKKLPHDLGLLYVSSTDVPSLPVQMDFASDIQNATLHEDNEFTRKAEYSFSIIQHIGRLVNNKPVPSPSLFISLPITPFSQNVDQLRIGNGKNQESKVKLEIYLSRLK
jgi:hypothetical protein